MGIENGTYRGKARSWALAESPNKGTPEVAVEFELTDPEMGGQGITWHGYLTEGAFERTVQALRYCGWEGDDLSALDGLDKNEVSLVVENETYNGKTHAKVKWVNKPGGLAIKAPMPADKVKTFAAQMRGRIRALDAQAGKKLSNGARVPPGAPGSEPIAEDDIPF